MKKLLTIALLLAVAASASALDRSPRKKKRDRKAKTETVAPAPVPEAEPVPVSEPEPAPAEEPVVNDMTLGFSPEQTDSLLAAWRERQRQDAYSEFFKQYILEDSTEVADSTPDSVYSRRLLDLASPIQFPYNSIVKGYINRYTNSRYGTISRILGMSQYYFPIIEEELLREGLPVELRALPIIESALSPTAVSPMGAVGLWQFMPTTGKSYGLEINSLVDERRDPYRATQAACRWPSPPTTAARATSTRPSPVREARISGRYTTTCPARRAATCRPSSARRTPTPTTACTASSRPKPRFPFRWTPSGSTS